jgi:colanic acid/amylovoran biosynthesis glycosyltransferase
VRVAVVVSFFPSVSQTFVLNQITGLIDRGHAVDIYAAGPEPAGARAVVPEAIGRYGLLDRVTYEPSRPARAPLQLAGAVRVVARRYRRRLGAALRVVAARHASDETPVQLLYQGAPFVGRPAYDAILCHFGPNGRRMVQLRAAGLVRGPIVTAFHGYDVSRYVAAHGDGAYRELFARGDLFLPVSYYWRRRLVELGAPIDRTVVHPMGIELGRFPLQLRRPDGSSVRLLSVARLVEKKGIEYGVRAVAALRAAGVRVSYTVIGDGPLRGRLDALVRELGVSDVVHLAGERDQGAVAAAMADAHLFLAPSVTASDGDMEGIPVSLMEAMASGLPVVATRHSGIPELVRDGVSGFLVPERDAEALAFVLDHLVRRPSRWTEVGRAARETIEREHDVEVLNDRLAALLEVREAVVTGVTNGAGAGVGVAGPT